MSLTAAGPGPSAEGIAVAGSAQLPVGSSAPDFTLRDQNNELVVLSELLGSGALALVVFYPAAFTGTCTGELQHLSADREFYRERDVEPLSISVDSVYAHKIFAAQEKLEIPLLADFWPHGEVAQAYGVFDAERGVAKRGTFLIDADGLIAFSELHDVGHARDPKQWRDTVTAIVGR